MYNYSDYPKNIGSKSEPEKAEIEMFAKDVINLVNKGMATVTEAIGILKIPENIRGEVIEMIAELRKTNK